MARGRTSRVRKAIFRIKDDALCPACGACPGWLGLKGLGLRARLHSKRCRARCSLLRGEDEDKRSAAVEFPASAASSEAATPAPVSLSTAPIASAAAAAAPVIVGAASAGGPSSNDGSGQESGAKVVELEAEAAEEANKLEVIPTDFVSLLPSTGSVPTDPAASSSFEQELPGRKASASLEEHDPPDTQLPVPSLRKDSFQDSAKRAFSEHSLGSGSTAATAKVADLDLRNGEIDTLNPLVQVEPTEPTPVATTMAVTQVPVCSAAPSPAIAPSSPHSTEIRQMPDGAKTMETVASTTESLGRPEARLSAATSSSQGPSTSAVSRLLLAGFDLSGDFKPERSRTSGCRPCAASQAAPAPTSSKKFGRKGAGRTKKGSAARRKTTSEVASVGGSEA